ncbi:MAG: hypothetical protein EAY65_03000 [Alphaproteobacteria bacterium]|nr:MAG: hypothetical protein EAY65_03000 [Alphaproteobacteria bacterium]
MSTYSISSIYKKFIIEGLKELSDRDFQEKIWTNTDNPEGLVASFTEAFIQLFEDSLVINAIEAGEIVLDKKVTLALKELYNLTVPIDDYRAPKEIISDPRMILVRQKAAEALALVLMSDGSESTVDIIDELPRAT